LAMNRAMNSSSRVLRFATNAHLVTGSKSKSRTRLTGSPGRQARCPSRREGATSPP
jgi:hypothetical protein